MEGVGLCWDVSRSRERGQQSRRRGTVLSCGEKQGWERPAGTAADTCLLGEAHQGAEARSSGRRKPHLISKTYFQSYLWRVLDSGAVEWGVRPSVPIFLSLIQ